MNDSHDDPRRDDLVLYGCGMILKGIIEHGNTSATITWQCEARPAWEWYGLDSTDGCGEDITVFSTLDRNKLLGVWRCAQEMADHFLAKHPLLDMEADDE